MPEPRQQRRAGTSNPGAPDLFKLLVESVEDDAMFLLDREGRVISWNKGAERIKGYRPDEIIGKSISVFYPPEDAERGESERLLREAARTGRARDEGWRVRKDGTRFWAEVVVTALHDEKGRLLGFAKVTRDLTERRRIEDALAESETRYRAAVNAASDAMITIDQDDTILFVNPATEAIFGYRAEELLGRDLTMLMPVDLRQRHLDGFHRYLATGTRHVNWKAVEFPGRHKNGREIPLELAFGEFERDGRRLFIGYARDVTARKQAQAERDRLLARERALAQIASALVRERELPRVAELIIDQTIRILHADTVGVWLADPDRRELSLLAYHGASSTVSNLLQRISYDAPTLTARTARTGHLEVDEELEVADPDLSLSRQVAAEEGMRSALSIPLHSQGRLVGVVTYGSAAPRHFTGADLDFNATVADLFAIAVENARLFDQVRETLRVREEFMAAAAHELKTPVTVISGQAQLFLRGGTPDEHLRRVLTTIVTQSDRIARLIEDLLSSARVRPGSAELRPERFDLSELVTGLVERMDRSTPNHDFAVEATTPRFVIADRSLIAEVVNRLMENAHRYSPEGSQIEVRVLRDDGSVIVSVVDHGVGVAPDRLPHIFEPFYEPVPPGMPGYVGIVSLGLSLSREIVEAHRGKIWVDGTPGGGSTFSFSLPLSEERP